MEFKGEGKGLSVIKLVPLFSIDWVKRGVEVFEGFIYIALSLKAHQKIKKSWRNLDKEELYKMWKAKSDQNLDKSEGLILIFW